MQHNYEYSMSNSEDQDESNNMPPTNNYPTTKNQQQQLINQKDMYLIYLYNLPLRMQHKFKQLPFILPVANNNNTASTTTTIPNTKINFGNNIQYNSAIGHIAWPCSVLLSTLLLNNHHIFFNGCCTSDSQFKSQQQEQYDYHIIEWGTGCGVVGIQLYHLLTLLLPSHNTTNRYHICLTDAYPDVLLSTQNTLKLNNDFMTQRYQPLPQQQQQQQHNLSIEISRYQWGSRRIPEVTFSTPTNLSKTRKIIPFYFGSDVFFSANNIYPLLYTIYHTQHPNIITYQHRDINIKMNLLLLAEQHDLQVDIIWSNNPNTPTINTHTTSTQHTSTTNTNQYKLYQYYNDIPMENDINPLFTLNLPPQPQDGLTNWTEGIFYTYTTSPQQFISHHPCDNEDLVLSSQGDIDQNMVKPYEIWTELEIWVIYPRSKFTIEPL